jgi:hypothetical protein
MNESSFLLQYQPIDSVVCTVHVRVEEVERLDYKQGMMYYIQTVSTARTMQKARDKILMQTINMDFIYSNSMLFSYEFIIKSRVVIIIIILLCLLLQ